jgi:hypothetical protein
MPLLFKPNRTGQGGGGTSSWLVGDSGMNAAVALHTAARRYCLARFTYWCDRYSELVSRGRDRQRNGDYTDKAYAIFPRYNVLKAIRVEIERIDPVADVTLEDMKVMLIRAGDTAEDDFTRNATNEIKQRVTDEERAAYCRYIEDLSALDLESIEPFPYRRVLDDEETKAIWSRLRRIWNITEHYWYPLSDRPSNEVEAFQASWNSIQPEVLRSLLAERGIERVWELREYGPQYEEDTVLFESLYTGSEGYWSAGDLDWIVYASHEGSVTVGGWVLSTLKSMHPAWKEHLWQGWRA